MKSSNISKSSTCSEKDIQNIKADFALASHEQRLCVALGKPAKIIIWVQDGAVGECVSSSKN